MMARVHAAIEGMVQGVGYRQATMLRARKAGLTGWVRNLPDGRVEVLIEGKRPALEDFVAWLAEGPARGRVDRVEANWNNLPREFEDFRIAL